MKHTLHDVAFEIPDDLQDFSDYSYLSPEETATVIFQIANNEPGDADALLAFARTHYEGAYGPLIIYSSPMTFTRGDKSSAPGLEGEQRDMNDGSKRIRFAIAAIASERGKAVALYNGPSRPDALRLFQQVMRVTFVLGELGAVRRNIPNGWTRRQANRMLFALPRDWTGPTTLVFRSGIELRVTVAEPSVPEGTIDLAIDGGADGARTLMKLKTEPVGVHGVHGWTGEWRSQGRGEPTGDEKIVRKMNVTVAGTTVLTAYGKSPVAGASRLEQAWSTLTRSVRPQEALDG